MAAIKKVTTTAAHRCLNHHQAVYENHVYTYVDRGGSHQVALSFAIDEHRVIKTLVMEADDCQPFLVLMHGDREVSTKRLARWMGVKRISPCDESKAQRVTGYQVGGISPFGTRTNLKVYVQVSILDLDQIYINGGRRGLMILIQPQVLLDCLDCQTVDLLLD